MVKTLREDDFDLSGFVLEHEPGLGDVVVVAELGVVFVEHADGPFKEFECFLGGLLDLLEPFEVDGHDFVGVELE